MRQAYAELYLQSGTGGCCFATLSLQAGIATHAGARRLACVVCNAGAGLLSRVFWH